MGALKGKFGLWVRFVLLMLVAAAMVFAAYFAYSVFSERAENERRALAEARTLSSQMQAGWDYIDSIQNRINYSNGHFDFKDVYCSVAGKSIARRFTERTDYSIRYVRENPRSGTDEPDEFEGRALAAFEAGGTECWEFTTLDGQPVFRYVSVLVADQGCLSCHGEPAGQKDVTGFLMEGMSLGDVAGAVSITLPMAAMDAEAKADLTGSIVFFCVLMAVVTLVLAWGLRRWVTTPIVTENDRLKREAQAQSNFLTIVTHELKTPLSAIIAHTELWGMRHGVAPDDDGSGRGAPGDDGSCRDEGVRKDEEAMEAIRLHSQMLLGQVNNVLDTARMDEGSLALIPEDVDVYDVVCMVRRMADPLARNRGIAFDAKVVPPVPVVRADREMLRRIMVNLVGNAIRYTGAGGSVELRISYDDGILSVAVRDTGEGIAPEDVGRVFDRFSSSAKGAVAENGGTGLGLSIVKSYAELAGGSVSVESVRGQGSTFSVRLPLEAAKVEEC